MRRRFNTRRGKKQVRPAILRGAPPTSDGAWRLLASCSISSRHRLPTGEHQATQIRGRRRARPSPHERSDRLATRAPMPRRRGLRPRGGLALADATRRYKRRLRAWGAARPAADRLSGAITGNDASTSEGALRSIAHGEVSRPTISLSPGFRHGVIGGRPANAA